MKHAYRESWQLYSSKNQYHLVQDDEFHGGALGEVIGHCMITKQCLQS